MIVAQCIHSVIRANDALSMNFLGRRAIRHDIAPRLFLELIEENKIPCDTQTSERSLMMQCSLRVRWITMGLR